LSVVSPLTSDPGALATGADARLAGILDPDDARAYQRFLSWSVGAGFKLAIVAMGTLAKRRALVAWTLNAIAGARMVNLQEGGSARTSLEKACEATGEVSLLVLANLEEAAEREKLCAQLNVQRDELARDFAVPCVVIAHPAAVLELQRIAPDFCDFAGLWLREERTQASALEGRLQAPIRDVTSSYGLGAAENSSDDLLVQARNAIVLGKIDEVRDLLARYDLKNPEAAASGARRIYLDGLLLGKEGEINKALLRLEEAERICKRTGDAFTHTAVLVDMARLQTMKGNLDEALLLLDRVIDISTAHENQALIVISLIEMAIIERIRANYASAREMLRKSVQISDEIGFPWGRAASLHQLADTENRQGNYVEARTLLREAIRVYDELGDRDSRAASLHQLAITESRQGNYAEARALLREALHIADELGNQLGRGASLHQLAIIEEEQGNYAEARALLRQAIQIGDDLGNPQGRAVSLHQLAVIELTQGNLAEAKALLHQAMQSEEVICDRRGLAASLILIGQIEAAQGHHDAGKQLVQKGVAVLEKLGAGELAQAQAILRAMEKEEKSSQDGPPSGMSTARAIQSE
jgi:tetratricopeptide (TPR) repeat protein